MGKAIAAIVVALLAYDIGRRDGEISLCRIGWERIEDVPAVWKSCEDRFGRALFD